MRKPALGHQLAIELYGCDPGVLDDVDSISRHMLGAAAAAGATVVGHSFHRFSPQGVSGVVIIAESHLAVHTWPEHGYAAVDLFTCGTKLRAEQAVQHLREALGAQGIEVTQLSRGVLPHAEPRPEPPPARHPGLFRYDAEFVRRFIDPALASPRPEQARGLVKELTEQVYQFQLFTPEFCALLIEEAEHRAAWVTVLEKVEEPHSAFTDVADLIEPDTTLSLSELAGACELYDAVIRHHVQPLLEGLWTTFRLQKWDLPAVRKYEPDVVRQMDLHYDAETVGMVGYLNADFEGGGTHFPRWGLTVGESGHVQVGSVIVYPGGVSHEHLARPITAGRRYTLANSFY
jgi:S-adenosylmethionine decarboxylase proenzyme